MPDTFLTAMYLAFAGLHLALLSTTIFLLYRRLLRRKHEDKGELLLNRRLFFSLISVVSAARVLGFTMRVLNNDTSNVTSMVVQAIPSAVCVSIQMLLLFFWAKLFFAMRAKAAQNQIAQAQVNASEQQALFQQPAESSFVAVSLPFQSPGANSLYPSRDGRTSSRSLDSARYYAHSAGTAPPEVDYTPLSQTPRYYDPETASVASYTSEVSHPVSYGSANFPGHRRPPIDRQHQPHQHPFYVSVNAVMYAALVLGIVTLYFASDESVIQYYIYGFLSCMFFVQFGLFIFFGHRLRGLLAFNPKKKSRTTLIKIAWLTAMVTSCFVLRAIIVVLQLWPVTKPIIDTHGTQIFYYLVLDVMPLTALVYFLQSLTAKRPSPTAAVVARPEPAG